MKEILTKTGQNLMVWKLAIVKCVLLSVVTLGTAIQTAFISIDYDEMTGWEKYLLWIGVFVLWGNQMLAFLDKTANSISSGKAPIGSMGNTDFLSKQKENG